MSFPLLTANAFQDLLDFARSDTGEELPTHQDHERELGLDEQFSVDWEVPQPS